MSGANTVLAGVVVALLGASLAVGAMQALSDPRTWVIYLAAFLGALAWYSALWVRRDEAILANADRLAVLRQQLQRLTEQRGELREQLAQLSRERRG